MAVAGLQRAAQACGRERKKLVQGAVGRRIKDRSDVLQDPQKGMAYVYARLRSSPAQVMTYMRSPDGRGH
eukprot:5787361-Alexandrium_andersonii.AAC.1